MEPNENQPAEQERWNDNCKEVIKEQESNIKKIEDDDDEVIVIN